MSDTVQTPAAETPPDLRRIRRQRSPAPETARVDQFYADVQAMGGNRLDTSSLIKRLR